MDFRFTKEEEAFRQEVRDFIKKEWGTQIGELEEAYTDENWPKALAFRKKLGQKKWIGIGWPKEYGGLGASVIMQMIFHEEMIYHHAPLDPQAYQVGPAIMTHGSEYLKKKFLSATANQELIWCQGFSEPNAGSDLASLTTKADEDGDYFVVNGSKTWTSLSSRAEWIHTLVRTDQNAPKHKGISYLVIDMHTPGLTIRPLVNITGTAGFSETFFDNVRVPKENLIGEKNKGWYVAMTTLGNERSGIRDVAGARRELDDLLGILKETKSISGVRRDKVMQHKLAEMSIEVQTSQNLSYRTGWMQYKGMHPEMEASMAKMFATELQQRIVKVGMEALGLYGQLWAGSKYALSNGVMARGYLQTVSGTIAAGSSEINRNIMATRGLGLPKGA